MTSEDALAPTSSPFPLELHELFTVAEWQECLPWQPFSQGTEIHRLYGSGTSGPSAALIRFQPGGSVPWHVHGGYEHILVLHGRQSDHNQVARAGTIIINPPGSAHSVVSDEGCIVLAIYEKPGRFDAPPPGSLPPSAS